MIHLAPILYYSIYRVYPRFSQGCPYFSHFLSESFPSLLFQKLPKFFHRLPCFPTYFWRFPNLSHVFLCFPTFSWKMARFSHGFAQFIPFVHQVFSGFLQFPSNSHVFNIPKVLFVFPYMFRRFPQVSPPFPSISIGIPDMFGGFPGIFLGFP